MFFYLSSFLNLFIFSFSVTLNILILNLFFSQLLVFPFFIFNRIKSSFISTPALIRVFSPRHGPEAPPSRTNLLLRLRLTLLLFVWTRCSGPTDRGGTRRDLSSTSGCRHTAGRNRAPHRFGNSGSCAIQQDCGSVLVLSGDETFGQFVLVDADLDGFPGI